MPVRAILGIYSSFCLIVLFLLNEHIVHTHTHTHTHTHDTA